MTESARRDVRDERQHAQQRLRQAQLLAEVANLGAERAKTTQELQAAVITAARDGVPIRHLARASLFSHVTVGKWVKHATQPHTNDFRPQGSAKKKEQIMEEKKAGQMPTNDSLPRPQEELRAHLENLKFTLVPIVKAAGAANPTVAGLLSGEFDRYLTEPWQRDLSHALTLVVRAFKNVSSMRSTSTEESEAVFVADDQPSKVVMLLEPRGWCDHHVRPVDTVLVGVETREQFGRSPGGQVSCARCLYDCLLPATDNEFGRSLLLILNQILIDSGEPDTGKLCSDENLIRTAPHVHRLEPSAADAEAYEKGGPNRSPMVDHDLEPF